VRLETVALELSECLSRRLHVRKELGTENDSRPRPPASDTAATSFGTPTLEFASKSIGIHVVVVTYHCIPPCTTGLAGTYHSMSE
jgi:hypothetical protein